MNAALPANLISSQKYLDDEIVAAKRAAADYCVAVCRVVADGAEYQVVVDGHHSLEAARLDGVEPELAPCHPEVQLAADRMGEDFLAGQQNDSDWYYVATGRNVW